MTKIKISKEEIRQMIKEEYQKKRTEIKLKNRLQQINEEIQKIMSEEETIEEVEAGGTEKVRSTGWTGENNGDEKWSAKFQKKGSHLTEEEEEGDNEMSDKMSDKMSDEDEMSDEIEIEEIPSGDEDMENDINAILEKLANAIEDKIESTVEEKMDGESNVEDSMSEPTEPVEDDSDVEEIPSEESEEDVVNEQDGESVIQGQKPKNATPFDNGKADIPKADQLVSEGAKKRMQILSGIRRNDFND
jgi:Skp family chaperone for outer membrane proteins